MVLGLGAAATDALGRGAPEGEDLGLALDTTAVLAGEERLRGGLEGDMPLCYLHPYPVVQCGVTRRTSASQGAAGRQNV